MANEKKQYGVGQNNEKHASKQGQNQSNQYGSNKSHGERNESKQAHSSSNSSMNRGNREAGSRRDEDME